MNNEAKTNDERITEEKSRLFLRRKLQQFKVNKFSTLNLNDTCEMVPTYFYLGIQSDHDHGLFYLFFCNDKLNILGAKYKDVKFFLNMYRHIM